MMNTNTRLTPTIRPWTIEELAGEYTLFAATVGYEQRARFIAAERTPNAKERVALGFKDHQVLHYAENTAWYQSSGFTVLHLSDPEFGQYWLETMQRLAVHREEDRIVSICFDISSLTRSRMAILIDMLRKHFSFPGFRADFVYSLAAFSEPPKTQPPNTHVGPIAPSFAGWWTEPDRATAAVVGLGYEEDKALGAVELLEPGDVWLLIPQSVVAEYSPALEVANRTLLDDIPKSHRLLYRVDQPFDCFAVLESLVDRLLREFNVILLPFGPKVFALCSLLVALLHSDAAVWRVSAGKTEVPLDRVPSGHVYGLSLRF